MRRVYVYRDVLQSSGKQCRGVLRLFRGLELCSSLELLSRGHFLTEIEPHIIVDALTRCPPITVEGHEPVASGISSPAGSVGKSHRSSIDVYRGFCALCNIISYIACSPSASSLNCCAEPSMGSAGTQSPPLVSAGNHIGDIVSPSLRLEVLEDAFSLLFARTEHLQESGDSPDRQSCDSDPDDTGKKRNEFVFEVATDCDDSPVAVSESLVERPSTEHAEVFSLGSQSSPSTQKQLQPAAELCQPGTLAADRRCSPMSCSSTEARSDEFSAGSQTVSTGSVRGNDDSGFLVRQDFVVREILSLLFDCCCELSAAMDCSKSVGDGQTDVLRGRTETLQLHITNALWRLRIVAFLSDSDGMCPPSEQPRSKLHRPRCKQSPDRNSSEPVSAADCCSEHTERNIVSRMLSPPESLMNLCLSEDRVADAEEVAKVCCVKKTPLLLVWGRKL